MIATQTADNLIEEALNRTTKGVANTQQRYNLNTINKVMNEYTRLMTQITSLESATNEAIIHELNRAITAIETDVQAAIANFQKTMGNNRAAITSITNIDTVQQQWTTISQGIEMIRGVNTILKSGLTTNNLGIGTVTEEAIKNTQELMVDIEAERLGNQFVDRGIRSIGGGSHQAGILKMSIRADDTTGEDASNIVQQVQNLNGPNGIKGKVRSIIGKKQSKVDVTITVPIANGLVQSGGVQKQFKISAKSWGNINGDLGETSIGAAVGRSGGGNGLEYYSLAILNPGIAAKAHEFARQCIALDIAAGFSQGQSNTADTLVINDRAHKRFRVFSMYDVIQNIIGKSNINNLKARIIGYDENSINSMADNVYNAMNNIKSPGRTNIYLGSVQAYLGAWKVSIAVSIK